MGLKWRKNAFQCTLAINLAWTRKKMLPHLCSSLKLRHSEKKYEIHHIKKCKPYPNLQLAAEMIVYATSHWMNTHEANAIFNQVLSQEFLKSFLKKGLGFSTNLGILIDNGGTTMEGPPFCVTRRRSSQQSAWNPDLETAFADNVFRRQC